MREVCEVSVIRKLLPYCGATRGGMGLKGGLESVVRESTFQYQYWGGGVEEGEMWCLETGQLNRRLSRPERR